jgi:hypothetical protein
MRMLRACLTAGLVLGLGACASTRVVDSEVGSFVGNVAPTTPASYRFDRLPSQQSADAKVQSAQESLEAWASAALADVGLTQSDAAPQYLAQISAKVEQVARTPAGAPFAPFAPFRMGGFWGVQPAPLGFGLNLAMEPPWSRYRVQIVLRESGSGRVVFESEAQHTGPWSDAANILPAVLRAALSDFPNPAPRGTTVRVEVGPQGLMNRP